MSGHLYSIQDTVIQIAEAISKMLQVDVEVIDVNHNRIAGTGEFKGKINQNNKDDGHGYRYTLSTGKRMIIDKPKEHIECMECTKKETCHSVLEITTPVLVEGKLEGAIGIICTDESRKAFLEGNKEDSLFFIDQMAELIAGKIQERKALQKHLNISRIMEIVMGGMENGVIILSSENRITMMNESAKQQLKMTENYIGEYVNIIVTGDTITGKKEFRVILKSGTHTVIGEYEIIEGGDQAYAKVLKFDGIRKYRNQMYHMTQQVLPHDIHSIIGNSENTKRLKEEIVMAANCNSSVLLMGEGGTGKELIGTAIWKESVRAEEPFVYFNCSSMPEELLEEGLFGVVYTNKVNHKRCGRIGKMEMANEGILFLDEVDSLPLYHQIKLEKVMKEHFFCRKGSSQRIPINVRVIAATKEDLTCLMEQGKFRSSLYYLISVIKIRISPLRERREDIEDLIYHYIDIFTKQYQTYFKKIDEETLEILKNYSWMGNVRELEATVEHMVSVMDESGIMDKSTIPKSFRYGRMVSSCEENVVRTLEEVEIEEIRRALRVFGTSKKGKQAAADALGIGIATLYRKMDRL